MSQPPTAIARALPLLLALAAGGAAAGRGEILVDRTAESGLDFWHFNGASGEFYFPEVAGAGAALLDYDNDGDLDAYLVQGAMLGPGRSLAEAAFPPRHPLPLTDRLYRNDARPGQTPRLVDVTAAAGLTAGGYGMGIATGDYDNDGWVDLYVTSLGSNRLLRNAGDGSFVDVTAGSGTDDRRWSVSATFFDFDGDGWLDLFIANYVDFSFAVHRACRTAAGLPDWCGPLAYDPVPDRLLRNNRDGTFSDVTVRAGIDRAFGAGLGVAAADFNGDGRLDLYVANDMHPNQLWINRGDGTFVDDALLAGSSVNRRGVPEASMGVAIDDFDGDGDEDVFLSHLSGESNTLYLNDGGGTFRDQTVELGLDAPSRGFTGFGTRWFDYDNDGWLDLLLVNGAVRVIAELAERRDPFPLHQKNQLFRYTGGGYEDVSAAAGTVFELSEVGRGAAFGDVDNDGDVDVLISNNNGPARLLVNAVGQRRSWLGLRLVAAGRGRDLVGTRAGLELGGNRWLWRRARTDSSYASANDPRLLFGLGDGGPPRRLAVEAPGGRVAVRGGLAAGRYHVLPLAGAIAP